MKAKSTYKKHKIACNLNVQFVYHSLKHYFWIYCASSSFLKLHIYKPTHFEFLLQQELPYFKDWALPLNLALKKYEGYNMVH